jgi:hypothetical protein
MFGGGRSVLNKWTSSRLDSCTSTPSLFGYLPTLGSGKLEPT